MLLAWLQPVRQSESDRVRRCRLRLDAHGLSSFVEDHPCLGARGEGEGPLPPRQASSRDADEAVIPRAVRHWNEFARREPVRAALVHLLRVDVEGDLLAIDLAHEPRMDAEPYRH